jgi:hypothetical protein
MKQQAYCQSGRNSTPTSSSADVARVQQVARLAGRAQAGAEQAATAAKNDARLGEGVLS